ncbi:MAG: hypothetical protein LBV69_07725 [Bacteroidales bacterium]|jgi:hypothetical protein|nr:hypothetical protein [Bacteroidales bacterium]
MKNILFSVRLVFLFIISFFLFSIVSYSQSIPVSTKGYSLEIKQIYPTVLKVETIKTDIKNLDEIDNLIKNDTKKRTKNNWIYTIKGPGNYSNTRIIQNISYILDFNGKISYLQNNDEITDLRKLSYPEITKIIITECSVYGTVKTTDTLNYIYSFKYFSTTDTSKISIEAKPIFSSEYFATIETRDSVASPYKSKINDLSENLVIRYFKNNIQTDAVENYGNFLKELETKKKSELKEIEEKNKKIEAEKLKKEKETEKLKVFDNLDLIEINDFKKLTSLLSIFSKNNPITKLKDIKDLYDKSNDVQKKEISSIIDNLLKK